MKDHCRYESYFRSILCGAVYMSGLIPVNNKLIAAFKSTVSAEHRPDDVNIGLNGCQTLANRSDYWPPIKAIIEYGVFIEQLADQTFYRFRASRLPHIVASY